MKKTVLFAALVVVILFSVSTVRAQEEVGMTCLNALHLYCFSDINEFNYTACLNAADDSYTDAMASLYLPYCAGTDSYGTQCPLIEQDCISIDAYSSETDYHTCFGSMMILYDEKAYPCSNDCGCTCDNEVTQDLKNACEAYDLPQCRQSCTDNYNTCIDNMNRADQGYATDIAWCNKYKESQITNKCSDVVCKEGQSCVDGACYWNEEALPKCTMDTECPVGFRCVGGGPDCYEEMCTSDSGCRPGEMCTDNGSCIDAGKCRDVVCKEGQSCVDGACYWNEEALPKCTMDSDCPVGFRCVGGGPDCYEEMCTSDSGCRPGEMCTNDSTCIESTHIIIPTKKNDSEPCTTGAECINGGCCNGKCTNIISDPTNCGACGNRCQVQWLCMNQTCKSQQEVMNGLKNNSAVIAASQNVSSSGNPIVDLVNGFVNWLLSLFRLH